MATKMLFKSFNDVNVLKHDMFSNSSDHGNVLWVTFFYKYFIPNEI